jgi:RNA polymerase sigma factor (sigma-70 family)
MRDASEQDLVARLGTDPAAFEEFYRRHVDAVTLFAVRRVGLPDQAADLVAEVFLEVIESAGRYDPDRGEPIAWVMGIAVNLAAAQRRRRASEARAVARISGQRLLDPDDYAELEAQIDAAQEARVLHDAIARLPEGERVLLALVSIDGLTPVQAARTLGIRPAAGRMRLARARRKVRAALAENTTATGSGGGRTEAGRPASSPFPHG